MFNKADLLLKVYKVIPVNCNGRPEYDGGLAGAYWRKYKDEAIEYKKYAFLIEKSGIALSDKSVFIDTMRGLEVLEMGLKELGKKSPAILLMPKIGGGIAGYDFEKEIRPLIEKYLTNHNIIYVEQ